MSTKYIGGQALIGGVMMKGKEFLAAVVESSDSKKHTYFIKRIKPMPKIFELLFLRGFVYMLEMMIVGMKTIIWSGNQQLEEEFQESMSNWHIFFLLLTSFSFAIGLFIILPLIATKLITNDGGILFNVIDGVFRVIVFILYLTAISKMPDVAEVFRYHGAEHKVVNCYENDKPLTVKNAQKFSTIHPRCGTTFIFIVLVISILLFSMVISNDWFVQFAIRVLFIPIISGIGYEVLKFTARHYKNPIVKVIMKPGLFLQKITTKEPRDSQVKCAILAMKKVIELEKRYKVA